VHKARNILERLPKPLHASVRKALRQAWELDDADKAERLIRNLARRLEQQAPGVAASILEGLDEILTVIRSVFLASCATRRPAPTSSRT
jgi:putative transposase